MSQNVENVEVDLLKDLHKEGELLFEDVKGLNVPDGIRNLIHARVICYVKDMLGYSDHGEISRITNLKECELMDTVGVSTEYKYFNYESNRLIPARHAHKKIKYLKYIIKDLNEQTDIKNDKLHVLINLISDTITIFSKINGVSYEDLNDILSPVGLIIICHYSAYARALEVETDPDIGSLNYSDILNLHLYKNDRIDELSNEELKAFVKEINCLKTDNVVHVTRVLGGMHKVPMASIVIYMYRGYFRNLLGSGYVYNAVSIILYWFSNHNLINNGITTDEADKFNNAVKNKTILDYVDTLNAIITLLSQRFYDEAKTMLKDLISKL